MGIEFVKIKEGECLLCGTKGPLTGEHKIKASLIREQFENRTAMISGITAPRIVQSSRSKSLHFRSKLCEDCNSSRTQAADRAFDVLHSELRRLYDNDIALTDVDNRPNCRPDNATEKDAFRYFAKIICCFLAEVGGPRSKSLSAFSLGRSERNPIFLRISKDAGYAAKLAALDSQGLAEHGGLKFGFDSRKKWVQSLECSLSVGGIHYEFWVQLHMLPKLELHFLFPELVRTALANIVQH